MARHRNVRGINYSDEYDGYDDVYGHSVEEESCLSPSDVSQFMYDRGRNRHVMSNFLKSHEEVDEESDANEAFHHTRLQRRESLDFRDLNLNDEDEAKFHSCLDELRNVLGDAYSDQILVSAILENNFEFDKALDQILNNNEKRNENKPVSSSPSNRQPILKELPKAKVEEIARVVTPTIDFKPTNVIKGFRINNGSLLDVNSPTTPRSQSPSSGRNTPVKQSDNSEEAKVNFKIKENKVDPEAQYNKERGLEKEHLYIVVIGHVDAGKSTLMGRLLCDLGEVSQKTLHKYEQESKKMGKQSFMYAWVLDETGEERVRGITMDVGRAQFTTKAKIVTILDAPGHADFIPNMIAGAGQADVALLVIDATRGEFETGFDQGGQTREHALLVRSLGVSQLAVAINKLDTSNWSEERFNEIIMKLKVFLKQAGFRESDVTYVPCSGLTGENLAKPPTEKELLAWYKGPSLLEVIDKFNVPERPVKKPLRISINDVYKGTGSGFCVSGKIETGVLNKGDKIILSPVRANVEVRNIMINDLSQNVAFAGDQVSITLSGVDMQQVSVGCILCDPILQIPVASRFEARIVIFKVKAPITSGFPVILHHQSLIEPACIVKLKALLNKSTGEVMKKKPRCLGNNSVAIIVIEASRPICLEKYKDCKELGRIMLRVAGVTIAAGLVTDIYTK